MSTPVDERPEPTYAQPPLSLRNASTVTEGRPSQERTLPSYNVNNAKRDNSRDKSSTDERTVVDEYDGTASEPNEKEKENAPPVVRDRTHLAVHIDTNNNNEHQYYPGGWPSPSQTREQASRLDDDLEVLKVERQVSRQYEDHNLRRSGSRTSDSMYQSSSRRREEHVDEFDEATNPVHEQAQAYKPPENPHTGFSKLIKRVHGSNVIFRWIFYVTPVTLILLIPLLLGALLFKGAVVGGVHLEWFMIWLEIVWLTLWLGRLIAKMLPWPIGLISSLFTDNSKKWRDMGKQLELPATLFFWWLAIEISFLPTMKHHQKGYPYRHTPSWMDSMNKVLISIFVAATLNFVEKIIIQLIAISFHLRTYADRIDLNKFQIGSLTKLYIFSRQKIAMEDSEFEAHSGQPGSGTRTPGQLVNEAAKTTKVAFNKFGDVAGKVAGDFTGKETKRSTHPSQVVLGLLHSTEGSQVLARRLYRTFAREETETVFADDLRNAFDNGDEADAAFSMFDKDLNGDISMEELEAVCVEIGRERKSITASLKDLDSVVSKLDDVFMFIVFVITILVFISLISASAAGVLTSAGSVVLGLSWLLSATAQDFLQSVIFVFVKHPFDVGDRVQIYGATGSEMKGDDYFVKEISLMYTEFKKMEGHVVQAPNSYLNTLFILNQRRSGGLAEAIPITIKYGTTLEQIDSLRTKLLEFAREEKREFQNKILTELRSINEVHSMTLNVIFFFKTNWQNEGLRLARRNKMICALMVCMQELGIEGPQMRYPGQKQSFPVYLQNVPHVQVPGSGHSGHPDQPGGISQDSSDGQQDPPFVAPLEREQSSTSNMPDPPLLRTGSTVPRTRPRNESLSQMSRRVDFSLGSKGSASGDQAGDVYQTRNKSRIPFEIREASRSRDRADREVEALRQSLERSSTNNKTSHDLGRSTSRDNHFFGAPSVSHQLSRRSTDGVGTGARWGSSSVHRNRFFSRGGHNTTQRAASLADEQSNLENGNSIGMADIPENPSRPGTSSGLAASPSAAPAPLDPRSGLVSPRAWRTTTNESNIGPPQIRRAEGTALDGGVQLGVPQAQSAQTFAPASVGRSQTGAF